MYTQFKMVLHSFLQGFRNIWTQDIWPCIQTLPQMVQKKLHKNIVWAPISRSLSSLVYVVGNNTPYKMQINHSAEQPWPWGPTGVSQKWLVKHKVLLLETFSLLFCSWRSVIGYEVPQCMTKLLFKIRSIFCSSCKINKSSKTRKGFKIWLNVSKAQSHLFAIFF